MKKYVDKDGLAYFAQEFYDKTKDVFATKAQVGSPLVAATVAGMTDTDKIYVYTGSETGYTAGDWYYYDGSDWVSGGVYNAVAVQTDTTLSVAGMAADADAVGNAVSILDGRIDAIEDDYVTESEMASAIDANIDDALLESGKSAEAKAVGNNFDDIVGGLICIGWIKDKRISTSGATVNYGSPSSTTLKYACIVADCVTGDIFTLTGTNNNNGYALWCWCALDGTVIQKATSTLSFTSEEIIAPTGAKKLICNVVYTSDYQLIKGRVVKKTAANAECLALENTNILSLFPKSDNTSADLVYTWDKDGLSCEVSGTSTGISTNHIYSNTGKLPNGIEAGKTYRVIYQSDQVNLRIVWYDISGRDTLLLNVKGAVNRLITIPNDAAGMSIRLQAASGLEVDETVTPIIYKEKTDIAKMAARKSIGAAEDNSSNNLITAFAKKNDISATVVFTWSDFDSSCVVIGTPSGTAINYIYRNTTALPEGFTPGGKYVVSCDAQKVQLRIVWYDGDGTDTLLVSTSGVEEVVIPDEAVGLSIRLHIPSTAGAVSETVYPKIFRVGTESEKTTQRLLIGAASDALDGATIPTAHLLAVGNSFIRGAVYTGGSMDHLSAYENTVYGVISTMQSIPKDNVVNVLHSSSGIVKENDGQNLCDIIKTYDLSVYDYVLTGMSGSDMQTAIGDIDATADDGTIAGAVVGLLSYINSSNGMCKLILLSVPPYSSDLDKSGQNTFTGLYSNGKNLTDLDNLMFALAKKYHFTYVSWQDNPMSYHYMDFADYIGDNEGSRHASSEATYRAMGEYAANQIRCVNSPIALKMIADIE